MTSSRQPGRRRYDASGRQAQAKENRGRVLAAATRLFVEQGYAATSVAQVAAAAGVSAPTVFAHFTSKANLLKLAVETAIVGDDEPVPLHDRPAMRQVREGDTAEEVLRRFAEAATEIAARSFPIYVVVRGAADADPEIAELARTLDEQRLAGAGFVARAVADRLAGVAAPAASTAPASLAASTAQESSPAPAPTPTPTDQADAETQPDSATVERIRDAVWTLFSPDVYDLIVVRRGWSPEAYRAFVVTAAAAVVVPPP
jgi:TetR/AcrR family transcriptional regulator, regulator of autoinduction and epiphytic fitness